MVIVIIFSPIIVLYRILKKKESPTRFLEKFGFLQKKEVAVNYYGSIVLVLESF